MILNQELEKMKQKMEKMEAEIAARWEILKTIEAQLESHELRWAILLQQTDTHHQENTDLQPRQKRQRTLAEKERTERVEDFYKSTKENCAKHTQPLLR